MRKSSKRPVAIAAVTLLLLGIGGAAFAYWTATGSGTGTGTTGTTAAVTVVQTSTVTNLRPGGAPQALSGNFNNPNSGPTYVTSVSVTIGTITGGTGTPACTAADYTITGSPMTVNANVPAGTAQGSWSGASIAFNNSTTANQDACKNATVNLVYTSN